MKILFFFLIVILQMGCQPPVTTFSMEKPASHVVPEQTVFHFNQGKQESWDDVLSTFATTDFSIERINIHAYQVVLRLKGSPYQFVDCGKKKVSTDGNTIRVVNATGNYSYTAYQHIHLETFTINNQFTGYASLLITGDDETSRIHVKYELELETLETKTTTRGPQWGNEREEILQFTAGQPGYSNIFNMECRSTGKLEKSVMDSIRLIPGREEYSPGL